MKFTLGLLLAGLLSLSNLLAGSATWNVSPTNGNWNTASNWSPPTVPNSPADVAMFGISNTTAVSFSASVEVNGIVYNPGASAFTISIVPSQVLTLSGVGITNNSGTVQSFSLGTDPAEINFTNSATAGIQTAFTTAGGVSELGNGGEVVFSDTSTAGDALFVNNPGTQNSAHGGLVIFSGSSTAGDAVFMNNGGTVVNSSGGSAYFFDSSNAGNATITNNGRGGSNALTGGTTAFQYTSSAGTATIVNMPNGNDLITGTTFDNAATAENSVITNEGATVSGQIGGNTQFEGSSSAGNSTIICNGGTVTGAGGGGVLFWEGSKTGNATLIAIGGINGGDGGEIRLQQRPSAHGGAPRVQLSGNGALETSLSLATIGSLEGDGIVELGDGGISVGSNSLDTTFSGVIENPVSANLTKVGSGTLVLSGANTYTGTTTVSQGALIVSNMMGSATGTGTVSVNAGTLGGSGIISGNVIIGTGSGRGAILAPSAGSRRQLLLTLQSSLTLQADATYTYTFKARNSQLQTDLVQASGVTINEARIRFKAKTEGTLTSGMVLTLLSNTSANPITGTFANLPDGAIVTINGNNFQASYEGGDGNDVTLTVVP
jgi:autotransporter-associated beta strand protein